MAIRALELENFRGQSKRYEFNSTTNTLVGKNGAGKSTIKEAFCFALCGTDSVSTRNPQHLLTANTKGLKVALVTDRSEISRTLTAAGNGTLKLKKAGVSTTLNQSQLEIMLGSVDLVLSVMIPGYFGRLSVDKKNKVISEVIPTDRKTLFARLAEFQLEDDELIRYDYINKRADLVANAVASDRRMSENELYKLIGEVNFLSQTPESRFVKNETLEVMENTIQIEMQERIKHKQIVQQYEQMVAKQRTIEESNTQKAQRRSELAASLEKLILVNRPEQPIAPDLSSLRSQLQQLPGRPALQGIVEGNSCPTCGQTVADKHREMVRKENERLQSMYTAECNKVSEHNKQIEQQLKELNDKYNAELKAYLDIVKNNEKIAATRRSIESEIAQLVPSPLPEVIIPQQRLTAISDQEIEEHKIAWDKYRDELANHNRMVKARNDAEQKLTTVKHDKRNLECAVSRLGVIEHVVKLLPSEEMKLKAQHFEFDGIKMVVNDNNVELFQNGMPYGILSTGQQMKVDVAICCKLNSLMKSPLGIIFLDNADLVDAIPEVQQMQVFLAKVDNNKNEVEVL